MLTAGLNALGLIRIGGGRGGGGFFLLLIELTVVGVIVWALTRSKKSESAKE